jgi:hypothetical protein
MIIGPGGQVLSIFMISLNEHFRRRAQVLLTSACEDYRGLTIECTPPTPQLLYDLAFCHHVLAFVDLTMDRSRLSPLLEQLFHHDSRVCVGFGVEAGAAPSWKGENPAFAAMADRITTADFLNDSVMRLWIVRALRQAACQDVRLIVRRELPKLPFQVTDALVAKAGAIRSTKALAPELKQRVSTVHRWCSEGGVRHVSRLAIWIEIELAAALMCTGVANCALAAGIAGFPTPQAFCNATRRYAHMNPGEFCTETGRGQVVARFRDALAAGQI